MGLESVGQLQALNRIMARQFADADASGAMVLGVAGGNGLEHADPGQYRVLYGVDVNPAYLKETAARFRHLGPMLRLIEADLTDGDVRLPHAELLIADLLIEYIGIDCFKKTVGAVSPRRISCVLQSDTGGGWVSDSPWQHSFDALEEVHRQIDPEALTAAMEEIGYREALRETQPLSNGKALVRLDLVRTD